LWEVEQMSQVGGTKTKYEEKNGKFTLIDTEIIDIYI